MDPVKKLLVFAHKGEADFFIKNLNLQLAKDFSSFYEGDDYFLLLTGEDNTYLIYALTSILTRFKHTISEVINLGISGTVQDEIPVDSFHSIKSVYRYKGNQFYKKSYTLNPNSTPALDVMTLDVTLDEQEKLREEVSYFASLVDKELWYIAWVCDKLDKPLSAYKMVSDQAKEIPVDKIVQTKKKYALVLWENFSLVLNERVKMNPVKLLKIKIEKFLEEKFYFTKQQQIQLKEILTKQKTLKQLEVFYGYMIKADESEIIPKKKTQKLFSLVSPTGFNERLQENFWELLPEVMKKAMQKKAIHLQIADVEQAKLRMSFYFQSLKEYQEKKKIINTVNYQKIFNLLDGDL